MPSHFTFLDASTKYLFVGADRKLTRGQFSVGANRRLSDSGAKARFYHAVCEAHMSKILNVDMTSDMFTYAVDDKALRLARMMDGKLLMVTNAPDLSPEQVKERYKLWQT